MASKKFDPDEFVLELSDRLKEVSRYPNIKKYEPHEKQHDFHSSYKKKKLYIGGNRSGKTTGGVTEAIWRATCRHPYRPDLNAKGPTKGRVIAVDFVNGVEKIIFPQYKQWLYPSAYKGGSWETAYDKWTRTLTFANGSTIEFMSYDQDLVKFAGTSRDWIHFDEEPPHTIFVENLARIMDRDGDFWITMTPVEGITWVYDELYEGNAHNPDGDVLVIEINTLENPFLNPNAIESFLNGVDEDEVTARIRGQFVQVGGRIYKNFDPTVGGTHVLQNPIDEPKDYFKDWLWILGLDHGLNNPTAVLWTAIDKNGFAITFDELYHKEWTVDQHAKAILHKIKKHGRVPDILIADPSIVARNGITGTSIQQEYQKYGISFTSGNNDVSAGLIRVKRYFNKVRYVGKRIHPAFVDKNDAAIDVFPSMRITPNCSNLIWELKRYRWKTYSNKKLAYENNAFDQPHKKDDHAVDALRYIVMSQPDLFAANDRSTIGGFKSQLDEAMLSNFGGIDPIDRDVSDPMGLHSSDSQWTSENSIPSDLGGEWEFDEHMGGIY